jgi:hypothetical protein
VALFCSLVGCNNSSIPGRPEVYPVSGELFVNGRPAAKAIVELRVVGNLLKDHWRPHAIVDEDGSFSLTTFKTDDGAPVGDYALTVSWPSPPKRPFDPNGPDRFKGGYADPRRPVRQVHIAADENNLGRIDLP